MADLLEPKGIRARPSPSADAARAAQLERIRALEPLERMALAFALGRRCRTIAEAARADRGPER